jgi:hypothetical protein
LQPQSLRRAVGTFPLLAIYVCGLLFCGADHAQPPRARLSSVVLLPAFHFYLETDAAGQRAISSAAKRHEFCIPSRRSPAEKEMRSVMLAVLALAVGVAAMPLSAETKQAESMAAAPSFDDCFRLAWVRGVHVERGELPDFDAECMANKIPFNSGMAVDSVQRGAN